MDRHASTPRLFARRRSRAAPPGRPVGRRVFAAVSLALLAAVPSRAQQAPPPLTPGAPAPATTGFPSRPVRALVGFPPGGATDILARLLQQAMGDHLGQPVVIENRPGANSQIATQELVRAAPDGHTIGWMVSGHAGLAAIQQRNLPFDPVRDISYISMVARIPAIVAVPPGSPVRSVQDLIALARVTPAGLTYSTAGPGGWQHFGVTDFGRRLGLALVHVPYRGGAPANQALATGEVAFSFANFASVHALLQSGAVRGIAVTGTERSPELPDLPTVAEAVPLPGFRTVDWYALAGPAGVAPDRLARIGAAVHAALARPELAARLRTLGATPSPSTPAEMEAFIRAEIAHYTELALATGIRAE